MIIGISGKLGVGKDYVANILFRKLRYSAKCSFADPLKRVVMQQHGVPFEDLYVQKTQRSRALLQSCGDDGRRVDENCWVNQMRQELKLLQFRGYEHILIPDVRFPNEAALVKEMGGVLIRVVSNVRNKIRADAEQCDTTHPSETALDHYPFHITLYNTLPHVHLQYTTRDTDSSRNVFVSFFTIEELCDYLIVKLLKN